jgi:aryl-alcohol dehydrogenase-like predicted oxidoreductase
MDRIISNQPQYSMLWRVIEAEVVPTSMELGIGQIIWSPLAQGVLTGKYRTGEEPPAGSRAAHEEGRTYLRDWLRDEVLGAVDRLRPVAEGHGISMAQLALAWALARPGVSSVIIGASRPQQIADNVAALDVTLDDATLAAIDEALGDVVERDPAKTDDASPRW